MGGWGFHVREESIGGRGKEALYRGAILGQDLAPPRRVGQREGSVIKRGLQIYFPPAPGTAALET